MPKVRSRSRQLTFAANFLQSRADRNIFVTEPTSGTVARTKGSLYVVTECDGDSATDRAFCRLVGEHLRNEYYRSGARGAADALDAAFRVAANKIRHDERNPDDAARPLIGLCGIAICDEKIVVGQTAPVQAYLRLGHQVRLIPDPPLWDQEQVDLSPRHFLGFADDVAYSLAEFDFTLGDLALVCSSALAQSLTRQRAERVLARRDMSAASQELREVYTDTASDPGYGLLLQVVPDDREDVAAEGGDDAEPAELLPGVLSRLRPGASARQPSMNGRTIEPKRPSPAAVLDRHGGEAARRSEGAGHAPTATAPPTATRASSGPAAPAASAQRRPQRRPMPVGNASPWLSRRVPTGMLSSAGFKMAATAVIAALVIVAGSRLIDRFHVAQEQRAIQQIVTTIKGDETRAAAAPDAAAQLAALRTALQATEDHKATLPATEYIALKTEVQGKIDQIERIGHFGTLAPIGSFAGQPQLSFSRIAVDGTTVYALDQGQHRVDVMSLAGGKPTFPLAPGVKVGVDVVGNVLLMAAAPGGLYAIDDRHVMWHYALSSKKVAKVTVAGSNNWQDPRAMTVFGDKLLVLDAKQSRIFQYTLGKGPLGPATDYLAPTPTGTAPDLSHSSDMAADASSVYVLQADGTVLRFTNGKRVDFPESGLAVPMTSPSSIFASGHDAAIYVADPSNKRVVKLAKDGRFLQQLRLPDSQATLGPIQAVAVDESQNKAVIALDSSLDVATVGAP